MCFLVVNCNVLIALGSSSVLQNFWCNLPFKKSTRHSRTLLRLLGNLTIYDFPRAPLRFLVYFRSRTESPGPRIKISKNEKKHPQGFTQALGVPNFRQISLLIPFLERSKCFSVHLVSKTESPESKNQNFHRMKKMPPEIDPSYTYAKFQRDLTVCSFPRMP